MTDLYKAIHFSIIIAKDWKQFICSLVRDTGSIAYIHGVQSLFKNEGSPGQ